MILNADGSFDPDNYLIKVDDWDQINTLLAEIKEKNGWVGWFSFSVCEEWKEGTSCTMAFGWQHFIAALFYIEEVPGCQHAAAIEDEDIRRDYLMGII